MEEAEQWHRVNLETDPNDEKLKLINYWNLHVCGGSDILGTKKCLHLPWYCIAHIVEKNHLKISSPEIPKLIEKFPPR